MEVTVQELLCIPSFLRGSAVDADQRMRDVFRRIRGKWPGSAKSLDCMTVPLDTVLVAGPDVLVTCCDRGPEWRVVDVLLLLLCVSDMRASASVIDERERRFAEDLLRCEWASVTVVASNYCRTREMAVCGLETILRNVHTLGLYRWQLYDTEQSVVPLGTALRVLLRRQFLLHGLGADRDISTNELSELLEALKSADVDSLSCSIVGRFYDEVLSEFYGDRGVVDPDGRILVPGAFTAYASESTECFERALWKPEFELQRYLRTHGLEPTPRSQHR